jgi:hypothetical protein
VRNLVAHFERGTWVEGVGEWCVEDDIKVYEGKDNRRVEETT